MIVCFKIIANLCFIMMFVNHFQYILKHGKINIYIDMSADCQCHGFTSHSQFELFQSSTVLLKNELPTVRSCT